MNKDVVLTVIQEIINKDPQIKSTPSRASVLLEDDTLISFTIEGQEDDDYLESFEESFEESWDESWEDSDC